MKIALLHQEIEELAVIYKCKDEYEIYSNCYDCRFEGDELDLTDHYRCPIERTQGVISIIENGIELFYKLTELEDE